MTVGLSLVVAADDHDVIGASGDLPWLLRADLRRFRALTTGHVVVAGRRTQESIVRRLGRALPDRLTVVASRTLRGGDTAVVYQPTVATALAVARGIEAFAGRNEVFVIGGAQVYAEALADVDRIHLTRVHLSVAGDTAMPAGWLAGFTRTYAEPGEESGIRYTFETYCRD